MEISIIGAGITGLTTALALNQRGFQSRVYERSPGLNEVGAGIMIPPNALVVFDRLGIGDQIRNRGNAVWQAQITNCNLVPFRKGDFFTHRSNISNNTSIAIHRASLQEILFLSLPPDKVAFNSEYMSHVENDNKIVMQLNNSKLDTDLLLGADGIHSNVRKHLFPSSGIRYSGQTCWRGISNMLVKEEMINTVTEAWGKGIRFGFTNISRSEIYWFAVVKTRQNQKDVRSEIKSDLQERFKYFHPFVLELISNTDPGKIIRNDIIDLKRLQTWHKYRTCLMGDAAHATTPNMGQGGAQGVEDACYLTHYLTMSHDFNRAFEGFEKMRREKVDFIVNQSWRFGKLIHSSFGRQFLKLMLKYSSEKLLAMQMKKVYTLHDPFIP